MTRAKGPSIAVIAALAVLAISLWTENKLTTSLLWSIGIYVLFSVITFVYRVWRKQVGK